MRMLSAVFIVVLFFVPAFSQTPGDYIYKNYEQYLEKSINQRRFHIEDIAPVLTSLKSPFSTELAGKSIEGRPIYLIKAGTGPVKVLLWSQMHGDESTATMALLDIFNYFQSSDDPMGYKKTILEELTLYFVPMLNPDGAARFDRRNSLGVDLNRDALRLQSPEARLLKQIRDQTDADWGFNLHDQSRYYSVGASDKTATISFLAPAFNYPKEVNPVRQRAMQLIGLMNQTLQRYMPGQVAKYNDTFEPRAFGDNIQKWGTSTILIESGGYPGDREKQFIRKMNVVALVQAFHQIATRQYQNISVEPYEQIPFNGRYFQELLIKNATLPLRGEEYLVDLAFRCGERSFDHARSFYTTCQISDVGDLSVYHGYEELEARGHTIIPAKVYPKLIKKWRKFKKLNFTKLHRQGFGAVRVRGLNARQRAADYPVLLLGENEKMDVDFMVGNNPAFFLEKNGKKQFLVANGQWYELE